MNPNTALATLIWYLTFMNHLLAHSIVASLFDFNLQPHMIAIVVPIVGMAFGAIMFGITNGPNFGTKPRESRWRKASPFLLSPMGRR